MDNEENFRSFSFLYIFSWWIVCPKHQKLSSLFFPTFNMFHNFSFLLDWWVYSLDGKNTSLSGHWSLIPRRNLIDKFFSYATCCMETIIDRILTSWPFSQPLQHFLVNFQFYFCSSSSLACFFFMPRNIYYTHVHFSFSFFLQHSLFSLFRLHFEVPKAEGTYTWDLIFFPFFRC